MGLWSFKAGREQDLQLSSGCWQDSGLCGPLQRPGVHQKQGRHASKMGVTALCHLVSEVTYAFPVFLVKSRSQALAMPKGGSCIDANPGGRVLGPAEVSVPLVCAVTGGVGGRSPPQRRVAPDTVTRPA